MSMPETVQERFQDLQGRFVTEQYVADYYGLEGLAENLDLTADLARYKQTLQAAPDAPDGRVDRYALEGFLQARRLLPAKWAAARLGLNEALLKTVLERRVDLPVPMRRDYVEYGCLVAEGLAEDLTRALPRLRFRTFPDHESFCELLHTALGQALAIPDGEIQEGKLWCATDRELSECGFGDYPRRYGYHFDCLTCEPLSVAHAVWLDFKKPITLGPDRCSKLVFVRYRDALESWVAGTRAPDDLQRYEECAAGVH
jgi:hypothetical protein